MRPWDRLEDQANLKNEWHTATVEGAASAQEGYRFTAVFQTGNRPWARIVRTEDVTVEVRLGMMTKITFGEPPAEREPNAFLDDAVPVRARLACTDSSVFVHLEVEFLTPHAASESDVARWLDKGITASTTSGGKTVTNRLLGIRLLGDCEDPSDQEAWRAAHEEAHAKAKAKMPVTPTGFSHIGGTLEQELQRSAEKFEEISADPEQGPAFALALMFDSGYGNARLGKVVEILLAKWKEDRKK
jgi:hypothetical protein